MSAVERQELLDAATPRPWRIDEDDHQCSIYGGPDNAIEDVAILDEDERGHASADLIVAAVNEYEALLACEAGLRAIVGFLQPTSRYALHAREALEQLDRVREE